MTIPTLRSLISCRHTTRSVNPSSPSLSCLTSTNCSQSAISIFINNIAVLAVENCLIKNLPAIFSPTLTADMDDEQLRAIASESEEIRSERASLEQKLSVLESGKHVLFEHMGKTSDRIFINTYLKCIQQCGPHSERSRSPLPLRHELSRGVQGLSRQTYSSMTRERGLLHRRSWTT
jgi:hypothetical protein